MSPRSGTERVVAHAMPHAKHGIENMMQFAEHRSMCVTPAMAALSAKPPSTLRAAHHLPRSAGRSRRPVGVDDRPRIAKTPRSTGRLAALIATLIRLQCSAKSARNRASNACSDAAPADPRMSTAARPSADSARVRGRGLVGCCNDDAPSAPVNEICSRFRAGVRAITSSGAAITTGARRARARRITTLKFLMKAT